MHLTLLPATPADLDAAASLYSPETGDLSAAACTVCWPVDPTDEPGLKARAVWSCQQQKEVLENDLTTRFVMIIDSDASAAEAIVAFGRWHEYTNGYQHVDDLETTGLKDRHDTATWPTGLNKSFYLGFLDQCFAQRRQWMGEGGHYWGTHHPPCA